MTMWIGDWKQHVCRSTFWTPSSSQGCTGHRRNPASWSSGDSAAGFPLAHIIPWSVNQESSREVPGFQTKKSCRHWFTRWNLDLKWHDVNWYQVANLFVPLHGCLVISFPQRNYIRYAYIYHARIIMHTKLLISVFTFVMSFFVHMFNPIVI